MFSSYSLYSQIMPVKMRCNKLPSEALQKEQIGIWSLLFYHWMTDTFKRGHFRPVEQSDLLPIEEQNKDFDQKPSKGLIRGKKCVLSSRENSSIAKMCGKDFTSQRDYSKGPMWNRGRDFFNSSMFTFLEYVHLVSLIALFLLTQRKCAFLLPVSP